MKRVAPIVPGASTKSLLLKQINMAGNPVEASLDNAIDDLRLPCGPAIVASATGWAMLINTPGFGRNPTECHAGILGHPREHKTLGVECVSP